MATACGTPTKPTFPPGAGGAQRLVHRLAGTHALQDPVGADPAGHLLDPGHALLAALGDDVGGAELARQLLPALVPGHRDDPGPVRSRPVPSRRSPRTGRPPRHRPRRRCRRAAPRRPRPRTSRCPSRRSRPAGWGCTPGRAARGWRLGCRRPAGCGCTRPGSRPRRRTRGASSWTGSRCGSWRMCCRRRRTIRRRTGRAGWFSHHCRPLRRHRRTRGRTGWAARRG